MDLNFFLWSSKNNYTNWIWISGSLSLITSSLICQKPDKILKLMKLRIWTHRQWMSCRPQSVCRWRYSPWWRRCQAGTAGPGSSTLSRRGQWCRLSSRRSPPHRNTGPGPRRRCSPAPGGAPRCREATGAATNRESWEIRDMMRSTSETWIISIMISHISDEDQEALVSVLVSWVTWWHFSPQSQRLDDIRWPRENNRWKWRQSMDCGWWQPSGTTQERI